MEEKYIIGLTGGIGSGKSRILEIMQQDYKARVIETDRVAKELEEPGQPGYLALTDAFGLEITGRDGLIRKDVVREMVFNDEKTREKINRLIHPLVWEYVKRQAQEGDFPILVAESALLLENPDDFFHEIWYVYTAREARIQRLMEGRGYSRQACLTMMAGQPSEEAYRSHADFVIDNNGPIEAVRGQIDRRIKSKSLK